MVILKRLILDYFVHFEILIEKSVLHDRLQVYHCISQFVAGDIHKVGL